MSEIMSLVYLKETGNVLSYVSRRAAPSDLEKIGTLEKKQQETLRAEELAAIVGEKLVIRCDWNPTDAIFKTAEFQIPPNQLGTFIAKVDINVLHNPHAYYIAKEEEISAVDNSSITLSYVDTSHITVTAPRNVSEGTKAWLCIQASNEQNSRIATATTPTPGTSQEIDITFSTLPAGNYLALAAVSGFAPIVKKFTVP